ncbi:MAG TPA: ABC transporter permease [Thermoanaerobaculia bacterium]|nr:ABC transporter permease [Thermoanaerobaculia bacterium]
MNGILGELSRAVRSLRRSPGFVLVAAGMLAVGIGANTAVFSVVDAVLLRPLPYEDPARIVRIWATAPERGLDLAEVSRQRYLDISAQNRTFESVGAFVLDSVNLTGGGEPARLHAARVSPEVLRTLRVRPSIGRNFVPAEESPGGPDAVLLGNRIWRERFGADPGILGRSIDIDGSPHAVVGILPAGFHFPDDDVDVWIPRIDSPSFLNRGNVERGSTYLDLVARVKPGVSPAQAKADLDRMAAIDRRTGFLDEGLRYRLVPLAEDLAREAKPMLLILLGAVALVLVIACGNVTNLLLVRAIERGREVAVRKALGASRGRLVRQFLAESVVMSVAAGILGVVLARIALPPLVALASRHVPRASEIHLDLRVLAATTGVAVATGLIFGLAPALQGARTDIRTALAENAGRAVGGARRRRIRDILVVSEVALAVALLMGAGLLFRTILHLEAVDPGFRPDHVVVARVDLPSSRYGKPDEMRTFFARLRQGLGSLPGVTAVGAAQAMPLSAGSQQTLLAAEGGPVLPLAERPIVSFDTVAFDYFRALAIPREAGRLFDDSDGPSAPIRVVVNRRLARRFFPGRDAVGRHVFIGRSTSPAEIVGVVGDVRSDGLDAAPREAFYLSALQHTVPSMLFALRSSRPPAFLGPLIRQRLRAIDPGLPLSELRSMDDIVGESIGSRRLIGQLLGVFAGIALSLAAIGLFGVLSYSVRQRSAEIGVRIALGAPPRRILAQTVGEGVRLAAFGLVAGMAAAMALTRSIASLLYDTRRADPATVAATCLFLLLAAAAASWIPARRAAKTDPMKALREE